MSEYFLADGVFNYDSSTTFYIFSDHNRRHHPNHLQSITTNACIDPFTVLLLLFSEGSSACVVVVMILLYGSGNNITMREYYTG